MDLSPLMGLPALLRMNPKELNEFIAKTHLGSNLAQVYMQMSLVLMALSQDEPSLEMQTLALELQRSYRIAGPTKPRIRLLAFMGPGNMLDNTPLDFVVEHGSIQLDLIFLYPNGTFPKVIPDHDIAIVAIGESEKNLPLLRSIQAVYQYWPRPILNHPGNVCNCSRDRSYHLLRNIPNLLIPKTKRITRPESSDFSFPYTIRPTDTHGGNGLTRLDCENDIDTYFAEFPSVTDYVAEYVNCQSGDGNFRKVRIVLIDHVPYVCHLAISSHWIVHYLSSDMDLDIKKRAEEELFMANFHDDFAIRFTPQISAMAQLLGLDYVTVDCAELNDGTLLVFEVDTRGLVHAADPISVYPYKPATMQKAFDAFESMLVKRIS
jgi:hypothetical protein